MAVLRSQREYISQLYQQARCNVLVLLLVLCFKLYTP